MASIKWGPYQNRVRLGILVSQQPATLKPSTMQVALDLELYIQTDGMLNLSGPVNITFTGAWTGQGSNSINLGPGQVTRIWKTTGYYATYLAAYDLVFGATVSHPNGPTYHGVYHRVAARPAAAPPKPNAPGTPSVSRNSDTRHTVSWVRNSTYTSVIVQRRENGGPWKQVAKPSGNAASWVDTSTKANRHYVYRVAGVNAGGTSNFSAQSASVYTTPAAPSGIKATRSGSTIRVSVPDLAPVPYATHFDVEDNGVVIASAVTRASLPYVHNNPAAAQHRYRIRGRVASGGSNSATLLGPWSGYSNTVQVLAPPNAPTKLAPNGVAVAVDASTRFEWMHNPTDASEQTERQIRWKTPGANVWTDLAAVATSNEYATIVPSSVFAGITGPVDWAVRTRGVHASFGPWSATATIDIITAPEVTIVSPSGAFDKPTLPVAWEWFQAEGRGQTSWEVELLDADSVVIESKSAAGSDTVWTPDARLESGSTYTVRVRAAAGTAWSAWEEHTFLVAFVAPLQPLLFGEWDEDSGSVTVSTGRGENDPAPDVTNHITDPRFTAASGVTVEVRRNLIFDPRCEDSTLRYEAAIRAVGGGPSVGSVAPSNEQSRSGSYSIKCTGALPSAKPSTNGYEPKPGEPAAASIWVFTADSKAMFKLTFSEVAPDGTVVGGTSMPLVPGVQNGWTELRGTATPANGANHLVPSVSLDSYATTNTFYADDWFLEAATTLGTTFDGYSNSLDPDLVASWSGTPNQSASILTGKAVSGVTGVNCLAIQSGRFGGSLRLIPTSKTSSDSYAYLTLPIAVRADGTAVANLQLEAPLTGALSARARCVVVESPAVVGTQPLNEAGGGTSRARYSSITSTNRVRLYHGGRRGSGEVYWTGLTTVTGEYLGEMFDGDSAMVNTGTGWKRGSWNGTPNASTSTATTINVIVESTDVLRSVDGGITWETFVKGANPDSNFVDWESLSNGDTMYRAIAYAEITGASSFADITVQALSQAIWLSGGEQFGLTGRLPFSPSVKVEAGRERSVQRYEGRSRGVAYAGEQLTRTVDASGTLIEDDDANATLAVLEALAQSEEPLHMYRDPDGRRIYGVLSSIALPRNGGNAAAIMWGWSFQLEETDH